MNKKCGALVALLVLALAGVVYKFVFQGSVEKSSDGRLAIQLDAAERDLVLAEMRAFLGSVQKITQSVTQKDMPAIIDAARKVGRAAQQAVPGTLMGKLPMEFKALGFDTHEKFDILALDAEQMGDTAQALEQLGTLLQNCVACHAAYRIELEAPK